MPQILRASLERLADPYGERQRMREAQQPQPPRWRRLGHRAVRLVARRLHVAAWAVSNRFSFIGRRGTGLTSRVHVFIEQLAAEASELTYRASSLMWGVAWLGYLVRRTASRLIFEMWDAIGRGLRFRGDDDRQRLWWS